MSDHAPHYFVGGKGYAAGGNVPTPEPSAPDDLREQIAVAVSSSGNPRLKDYERADAVMDVLRRNGVRRRGAAA